MTTLEFRHYKKSPTAKGLIVLASDHVGVGMKSNIVEFLATNPAGDGWDITDVGPHDTTRCDYPDYASIAAEQVLVKHKQYGESP
ncbi:galactose-6-phosphate isomerase [Spizellomyces sp. 'palustris']|nr:galactose-6-phosphate isomerase [Spizellomyces sp. 'palustris']